jgi:hypothetical protein
MSGEPVPALTLAYLLHTEKPSYPLHRNTLVYAEFLEFYESSVLHRPELIYINFLNLFCHQHECMLLWIMPITANRRTVLNSVLSLLDLVSFLRYTAPSFIPTTLINL